jgi:hypothetical protein
MMQFTDGYLNRRFNAAETREEQPEQASKNEEGCASIMQTLWTAVWHQKPTTTKMRGTYRHSNSMCTRGVIVFYGKGSAKADEHLLLSRVQAP